nr:sigma-70 family RNA polymerase sigma factor [uncultured Arsenicibacter sp.]
MVTLDNSFSDTDHEHWDGIRSGDKSALEALATRYYRPLFHYSTKFTANHAHIEDCLQDLFLTIWEKQQALPSVRSVKAYLFTAIRHNILHRTQRDSLFRPLNDTDDAEAPDISPERLLLRHEDDMVQQQQLKKSLDQLPQRQREAIYLRYFEDLSYEEIAHVMGLNRQVVANYLQHALQTLRKHYQKIVFTGLLVLLTWYWLS